MVLKIKSRSEHLVIKTIVMKKNIRYYYLL